VTARLSLAAAIACTSTVAAAGCGLGPGDSIGDVELTVTRDYGSRLILRASESKASESETAMRLLDRKAEISTRYGGGFVQSVEGIEGDTSDGRASDWFFYVNGVESEVGAADYKLHGGYRVWWDYRDWTAAMRVPAVVGSYPEPFLHGYDGKRHPVAVSCLGDGRACATVRKALREAGVNEAHGEDPIRVLVGPWAQLRRDGAASLIERGPAYSGVFADFLRTAGSWQLQELDFEGDPAGAARHAGLVAATRKGDAAPTWVVTGSSAAGTRAAANLLDQRDLRDRYAVAAVAGKTEPLPTR
jgi:Domain of unknown function (DUF4430)